VRVAYGGATGGADSGLCLEREHGQGYERKKKSCDCRRKKRSFVPLSEGNSRFLRKSYILFFCIAMIFNALQKSVLYQLFVIM